MANQANTDAADTGHDSDVDTADLDQEGTDAYAALMDDDTSDGDIEDDETDSDTEEAADDDSAATDEDDADDEGLSDDVDEPDADEDAADDSDTEEDKAAAKKAAAEERKRQNTEAAQRRQEEREQKRLAAKQKEQKEYIEDADSDSDRAIRQLQIDTYNNRTMQVTNTLHSSLNNAVNSPELREYFHSTNPEIRQAMVDAVDDFDRMYVTKDKHGDPTEVTADINAFLQKRAASIQRLTGLGAKRQEKDKQNQRKRSLTPPNKRAPSKGKGKSDPMLEAFDAEVASWKG